LLLWSLAGPEAVFGFAADFEGCDFLLSGVIPVQDFGCSNVVFARIQGMKQG
jgi:hypothetical protein